MGMTDGRYSVGFLLMAFRNRPVRPDARMFDRFRTYIHNRGMVDWRGILPLFEANFRRHTGCMARKFNEEQRQKTRQDAVQRL